MKFCYSINFSRPLPDGFLYSVSFIIIYSFCFSLVSALELSAHGYIFWLVLTHLYLLKEKRKKKKKLLNMLHLILPLNRLQLLQKHYSESVSQAASTDLPSIAFSIFPFTSSTAGHTISVGIIPILWLGMLSYVHICSLYIPLYSLPYLCIHSIRERVTVP